MYKIILWLQYISNNILEQQKRKIFSLYYNIKKLKYIYFQTVSILLSFAQSKSPAAIIPPQITPYKYAKKLKNLYKSNFAAC